MTAFEVVTIFYYSRLHEILAKFSHKN